MCPFRENILPTLPSKRAVRERQTKGKHKCLACYALTPCNAEIEPLNMGVTKREVDSPYPRKARRRLFPPAASRRNTPHALRTRVPCSRAQKRTRTASHPRPQPPGISCRALCHVSALQKHVKKYGAEDDKSCHWHRGVPHTLKCFHHALEPKPMEKSTRFVHYCLQ